MSIKEIESGRAPRAIGPYSQAVAAGDFVFVSGQIPADFGKNAAGQTIAELTDRCLTQISEILKSAGLSLSDVVKTTVYMADLSRFPEMNEAYSRRFAKPYPARATVEVRALPKGAPIEIDAVAFKGGG